MNQAASPSHRGDILVVDDTPENIRLLSAMLKRGGYRVRAVPSGALALEAARSEAPELVLLDVTMPGMDGYEVCRRLKQDEALRRIPVLFLSALSETCDKVQAFEAGGVDYVTKPFRAEEITARIETHLSIGRLQAQLQRSNDELTRSYARLQEVERLRLALVHMIVHDLKGPLAAIGANAGFVRNNAGVEGELALALDDIFRLSKVMGRMVLDVLDVAKADDTELKPRLELVDLRALFQDVVVDVRGAARGSQKRILIDVAAELPELVIGDRELLRRIIENLLENSLKYAPPASEVRIAAALAGEEHYAIRVEDEGPGVPAQHRKAVFEPYARLERDVAASARTSRGLGLAFCRMAAEAHRGQIWVEDAGHQGSVFVVRLPIDPGLWTGAATSPAGAYRRAS